MGKIRKKTYPFAICFITGLLWGVILGAVCISMIVSTRMDSFYERIAYLENTIIDKDEKLAKLEKSINTKDLVLKDIEVVLEFVNINQEQINEIDNIEIEKTIKDKFRSSIGKSIKSLDVEIMQEVIDKRILQFDGREYKLTVNKMVLTDVLKIWVHVTIMDVAS